MALVFRTDQTTPLTNDQVDNNFKYLRDQITLKYNTSDFTPANISLKLRTTTVGQTSLQLAEANAINAWTVRDLAPSSALPGSTNKASLVQRNDLGDIEVGTVTGSLEGNARSATSAGTAAKLTTARNINGVAFDGTAAITVADATKLPLAGGTMTGKLNLVAIADLYAPLNLGIAAPDANAKVNGDVWATSSGVMYHVNGQTDQIAPVNSPSFTGIPKAPGYTGSADQIITLSHLDAAKTSLNTSIALKSNIESPAFTGSPTAPTPALTSNNGQLATTSFVKSTTENSASDLTTSYQNYVNAALVTYSNAVNLLLASKAQLDSPELVGTPHAPTPTTGDNSTRLATTAFTNSTVSTLAANINASIAALQDAIASTRPVPVSTVFYTLSSTVPYGYFEAAGQYVSSLTYNDLWVALGRPAPANGDPVNTFRLPDLRGEFVRGWDHGRLVDAGRALGSLQYGSIQSHTHNYTDTYYREAWGPDGNGPGIGSRATDGDNYDYNYNRTTDATGENETRPRNIALMPIIKW